MVTRTVFNGLQRGFLVFACLSGFFPACVRATDAVQSESPQYLCAAERSYLENWLQGVASTVFPEDDSCFISLEQANIDQALIVDVRRADEFRKARIANSINLSPLELLNTSSLRNQPLLVVDQGFQRSAMARFCGRAKAEGVSNISILEYGLAGWAASGRKLAGLPHEVAALQEVSVEDFLAESSQSPLTVLVAADEAEAIRKVLPDQVRLAETESPTPSEQDYLELIGATGPNGYPVVIIDASGQASVSAVEWRNLFVLAVTPAELSTAVRRQQLVSDKRQDIPDRYRCQG